MIRVYWWNSGTWHEDVPEEKAMERVRCYTRLGYLCWWRRLDEQPPPDPAAA